MGEPAFLAEKDREAKELVRQRPLRYAILTVRRVIYTWTCFWNFMPRPWDDDSALPNVLTYTLISLLAWLGLVRAIRDRRDGVVPLAILLIFFPVIYYLTHPQIRFRHTIDPVIVILMVYGAMSLRKKRESGAERTLSESLEESAVQCHSHQPNQPADGTLQIRVV